ncbi:deoxyribodipyrimidine photolyase [Rhizobium sp. rho-13.1]|nr:deoxyribodipyrimidine photolyase [Rhizobium sp. L51/94]TQX86310.1 deoxyribodipyrimidine photolyase [Rhizobium sp. rho-13.1]TQY11771.1 deoxyribodipyrimidine photolyase [Rhizobium sp. rho-1.1]
MNELSFPLTRTAALQRLREFVPDAGASYARLRNFDHGPGGHVNVSRLSAALRRRLIGEDEVVRAVLAMHGPTTSEKFISEVFWRTYWKGWLEQRPTVWTGYLQSLDRAREHLDADTARARRFADACAGHTGIDCFDAWAAELDATGYLHNWARMQFASIWVFTLGLPWELGAAFMLDRLIDADPASNTLSWRWVAGLHTAGKAYLADAERIRTMTSGRFAPRRLAQHASITADTVSVPPASQPRISQTPDNTSPTLLLVTIEDLSLETLPAFDTLNVKAIAFLSEDDAADRTSLEDAFARLGLRWPDAVVLGALGPTAFHDAKASGCRQVATGFAPVGPTADRLQRLQRQALDEGLSFAENLRPWDRRAWPHCRKGFFGLKERIPELLKAAGHQA